MKIQSDNKRPKLSVVACFYNMRREAERTLYTLSHMYQRGVHKDMWEVIAVDSGSDQPLDKSTIDDLGPNFHYAYFDSSNPSPVDAINWAATKARGEYISILIDGARMLSPGVIYWTLRAYQAFPDAFVSTLAWHIGPKVQNESMLEGYDQQEEDTLLSSVPWKADGYNLFSISTLALSSGKGFFEPLAESNFCTLRTNLFRDMGGLETRFTTPGGGLVNHDLYRRACESGAPLVHILGEGTFHQFHGGVATNVTMDEHPRETYADEYLAIRGYRFARVSTRPIVIGLLPEQATRFLQP